MRKLTDKNALPHDACAELARRGSIAVEITPHQQEARCYRKTAIVASPRPKREEAELAFQSVFSARSIARVVRSGDSIQFQQDLTASGTAIIEQISTDAIARRIELSDHIQVQVRRKLCISYRSYPPNLVFRAIANYLARRFRVIAPNRDRIIDGVIESMMDSTPFFLIRRDISSFYESINATELRDRLVYDTAIPRLVRHYLGIFFDTHCSGNSGGIPRGIGLTPVLAELSMDRFDQSVRALPGVYRYFRYSDDIVIFAFSNSEFIEKTLPELLPTGMIFNPKKHQTIDFTGTQSSTNKHFDYLGYRIATSSPTGSKKPRKVNVCISESKIKRLKTRIILSLIAYRRDKDGELLIDRLRLLSSNFQLDRRGVSAWTHGKRTRSGIFYNYRRCGQYDGSVFTAIPPPSLKALDSFLHNLLKSPRSEFRGVLAAHLNDDQLMRLKRVSFRLGFKSRRLVRMPYGRLTTVKGAWRNG